MAKYMTEAIPLRADEIHLWLAYYDEINDAQLHNAYRQILNEAERQQEQRFYFASDRRRYLVTRAMVRTVLSRYATVHPRDWVFSSNAYGRPEICNGGAMDLQLSFNISHTHSLIILAVTGCGAVGVDVENIASREAPISIADRYFAPREVSELANVPDDQKHYRFFEYWTFKESYIKARGMGLSLPLDKFCFFFPHDREVKIDIHADLSDDAARWHFWQFQPTPDYLVAVCAGLWKAEHPGLRIYQIAPMQCVKLLALDTLRTSRHASLDPCV